MRNYRAEQNLKDNVIAPQTMQRAEPGYGIVLSYNMQDNTAMVLAARPNSDQTGDTYNNVPCPYLPGVQMVAPEHGTMCWLAFKDGNQSLPMIVTFFKHDYRDSAYSRQTIAANDLPQFMLEM